jgi:hypothetical protein
MKKQWNWTSDMKMYNYKSLDAQCRSLGMFLLYVCIYASLIRHIMGNREGNGTAT